MAESKVWTGSVWESAIMKVWDGSVWKPAAKFWDGAAWVDLSTPFVGPLGLEITPGGINQVSFGCPFTSILLSTVVSGGNPPFTYAWSWFTGGSNMVINNPVNPFTTVTKSNLGVSTGTLRCTVTDADTISAVDDVPVTMECTV